MIMQKNGVDEDIDAKVRAFLPGPSHCSAPGADTTPPVGPLALGVEGLRSVDHVLTNIVIELLPESGDAGETVSCAVRVILYQLE